MTKVICHFPISVSKEKQAIDCTCVKLLVFLHTGREGTLHSNVSFIFFFDSGDAEVSTQALKCKKKPHYSNCNDR